MIQLLFVFFVSSSAFSFAPKNFNEVDVDSWVNRVSGVSSIKTVGDPVPLGGYEGVEVLIASEWLTIPQKDTAKDRVEVLPTLRLGKGLYENFDVFIVTSLPLLKSDFSKWGFQARWMAWQAETAPLMAHLGCSYGSQEYYSLIITNSWSCEILGNLIVKKFRVFAGLGIVRSLTLFDAGSTQFSSEEVQRSAAFNKYLGGITFTSDNRSFGFQIDVVEETSLGASIGYRF